MKAYPPKKRVFTKPDIELRAKKSWISETDAIAFMPYTSAGTSYSRFTLYRKVHPCVILTPCPDCGAKKGQLCSSYSGGRPAGTHTGRRMHYAMRKR